MSRKPTKHHSAPKAADESAAEGSLIEDSKALEDAKTETTLPDQTPTKKTSLPAFGFAADLLGKNKAESASPIDPEEAARQDSGQSEGSTETLSTEPPTETIDVAPDRIFRFADSLDQVDDNDQQKVAQRITTWVTFELSGEKFALPVEPVREVLRVSGITRVPHAPKPIRGVTNLRGRVIPVIDLRLRIDLPPTPITRATRIIVVASRHRLIGLLVDAVQQVMHLDLNRVQPPPEDVMTVQSDYISGVYHLDETLILLLDVDRALIVRDDSESGSPAKSSGAA